MPTLQSEPRTVALITACFFPSQRSDLGLWYGNGAESKQPNPSKNSGDLRFRKCIHRFLSSPGSDFDPPYGRCATVPQGPVREGPLGRPLEVGFEKDRCHRFTPAPALTPTKVPFLILLGRVFWESQQAPGKSFQYSVFFVPSKSNSYPFQDLVTNFRT